MNRIVIIGIPGSGKSTLARKLGEQLGRLVVHLDKEYHTSDWERRFETKDEWVNFQKDLVAGDVWIIDGNYHSTLSLRLEKADTIIYLEFPKWLCLWRAIRRSFKKGQAFDKPEGVKEMISWKLVGHIISYPKTETSLLVHNYRDTKKVFVVRNDLETKEVLRSLTG